MNRATLIGRIGRDPESRAMQNSGKVVSFSLATTESWRDKQTGERKERTEWHNVVIFNEGIGRVAETYLKKGSRCAIEGQIQTREYTDRDGNQRKTTEIVLQAFNGSLELLDGPRERDDESRDRRPQNVRDAANRYAPGLGDDLNDSIPF